MLVANETSIRRMIFLGPVCRVGVKQQPRQLFDAFCCLNKTAVEGDTGFGMTDQCLFFRKESRNELRSPPFATAFSTKNTAAIAGS